MITPNIIITVYFTGIGLGFVCALIWWRIRVIRKNMENFDDTAFPVAFCVGLWPIALAAVTLYFIGRLFILKLVDPLVARWVTRADKPKKPKVVLDARDQKIAQLQERIRVLEDGADYRSVSAMKEKVR